MVQILWESPEGDPKEFSQHNWKLQLNYGNLQASKSYNHRKRCQNNLNVVFIFFDDH